MRTDWLLPVGSRSTGKERQYSAGWILLKPEGAGVSRGSQQKWGRSESLKLRYRTSRYPAAAGKGQRTAVCRQKTATGCWRERTQRELLTTDCNGGGPLTVAGGRVWTVGRSDGRWRKTATGCWRKTGTGCWRWRSWWRTGWRVLQWSGIFWCIAINAILVKRSAMLLPICWNHECVRSWITSDGRRPVIYSIYMWRSRQEQLPAEDRSP